MKAAPKTLPLLIGAPRICWRRRNSQLTEKTQQRRGSCDAWKRRKGSWASSIFTATATVNQFTAATFKATAATKNTDSSEWWRWWRRWWWWRCWLREEDEAVTREAAGTKMVVLLRSRSRGEMVMLRWSREQGKRRRFQLEEKMGWSWWWWCWRKKDRRWRRWSIMMMVISVLVRKKEMDTERARKRMKCMALFCSFL